MAPFFFIILFYFILFYFILFYFILFYFILFYFILFYFILFYFILFYFILFYFILFYFILFYFILFYFILFYFILFYFILFYFILFYFILFYFILFYFILFFIILLYFILLYFILLYFILFYFLIFSFILFFFFFFDFIYFIFLFPFFPSCFPAFPFLSFFLSSGWRGSVGPRHQQIRTASNAWDTLSFSSLFLLLFPLFFSSFVWVPNCHCPSFVTNIPFFLFLGDEGGLSQQVTRWFLSFPSLLSGRNKTKKAPPNKEEEDKEGLWGSAIWFSEGCWEGWFWVGVVVHVMGIMKR